VIDARAPRDSRAEAREERGSRVDAATLSLPNYRPDTPSISRDTLRWMIMWERSDGGSHSHPLPSHPFAATLPTVSKLPALPPVQSIPNGTARSGKRRESTAVRRLSIQDSSFYKPTTVPRQPTHRCAIRNRKWHATARAPRSSSSLEFYRKSRDGDSLRYRTMSARVATSRSHHRFRFVRRSDESANRHWIGRDCFDEQEAFDSRRTCRSE